MASTRKTFLVIFCLVFNGRSFCRGQTCAEFQVKQIHISDSVATLTFTVKPDCFPRYNPVNTIVAERVTGKRPHFLCQIFVDEKESCSGSPACTCSRSPENAFNIYSITHRVEKPDDETWSLHGILRNGNTFFKSVRIEEWIATTSLFFPVTSAAVKSAEVASNAVTDEAVTAYEAVTSDAGSLDPKEDQFPLLVVSLSVSLAAAVLVIIVIAVVFIYRRRQRSQGQVNQSSTEMAAVYSRTDPDVHHYLGLPPNRQAAAHEDEEEDGDDNEHEGYIEIDDAESRPGSSIYTEPREMSLLPSNRAPGDYLHPMASAQDTL